MEGYKVEDITGFINGTTKTVDSKTFIFCPSEDRDMKQEYPELGDINEFMMLTDAEMKFVWLLGNRTSPLHKDAKPNIERQKAHEEALKWSKLFNKLDDKLKSEYIDNKFPPKIHNAIVKMNSFIPSIRMKAKLMQEKMFNNLFKMVDVSEEEIKEMSLSEKKNYADLSKTITNTMDDLIVSSENAYGVKEVKRKSKELKGQQATLMDKVMNR